MNNNSLFQKMFPLNKKNGVYKYKPSKLSGSQNMKPRKNLEFSIDKAVAFALLLFFLLFNYSFIRFLGFEPKSRLEHFGMTLMVLLGAILGALVYLFQIQGREGTFGRLFISLLFSCIGDLIGVAVVFLIWFFIYIIASIGA